MSGFSSPLGEKLGPRRHFVRTPLLGAGQRVGLLGGSFNPAHAGHRHISLWALKRLQLDWLWWIVSPGNPLKSKAGLAAFSERVAMARTVAAHPRIVVTGFEAALGSAYSTDTLTFLARRSMDARFVWLMGADNLAGFHHWKNWRDIFQCVPLAVVNRPGWRFKAMASEAAVRFAQAQIDEADAGALARLQPPAWTLLSLPLSPLSSTEIRHSRGADSRLVRA